MGTERERHRSVDGEANKRGCAPGQGCRCRRGRCSLPGRLRPEEWGWPCLLGTPLVQSSVARTVSPSTDRLNSTSVCLHPEQYPCGLARSAQQISSRPCHVDRV